MGNTFSHCANELINVLRNCRSQDKGKYSKLMKQHGVCGSEERLEAEAEVGLLKDSNECRQYSFASFKSHSQDNSVEYNHEGILSMNNVELGHDFNQNSMTAQSCNISCSDNKILIKNEENQTGNEVFCQTSLIAAGVEVQMSERVIQLQQRQKKVLTQLQKLQESVNLLAQERGISLTMTAPNAQSSLPQNVALKDLVISVNPSYVPLSLLVLLKQLSAQQNILTSAFVHSSATNMPEKLRTLFQNGTSTGPRSNYQLAITVIWKEIPSGPRLMISPTQQTYIEGEANIARYLSRLLKPAYDDTDFITATQIDEFLDVSQLQLLRGNSKERSAALRTLNARLGKGQWLVGSSCSVADVVAWSAIQTLKLVEDAPANIKKWLKACSESSPFEEAFMFLSS